MFNHTDSYREYIIIESRKPGISPRPSVSTLKIVAIVMFIREDVMADGGHFPSTA